MSHQQKFPDFTQDEEEIEGDEWLDLREQCANFSPDSIWRKLLAQHDRLLAMLNMSPDDPMGQPMTVGTKVRVSPERPEIEPFILMDDAGTWAYHMTEEDLRIVMLALAGFELSRDERIQIRELYMCIFDALAPGQLKHPRIPRKGGQH